MKLYDLKQKIRNYFSKKSVSKREGTEETNKLEERLMTLRRLQLLSSRESPIEIMKQRFRDGYHLFPPPKI